ncbi:MAG: T9SS type A sorting domain-containing protein, partial [Ferruginibacter sp.]
TLDHLSSSEFWTLDRTVGSSSVSVTLSWDASRSGPISNLADLRVARWNGSLWKDEGNSLVTGTNAAGTITSAGAVTNFSPFTLASASPLNPLPVSLIRFTAGKCNGGVCVSWVTENEQNLSRYEIEKSSDGRIFSSILSLTAANTAVQKTYTANDISPFGGANFYRLKIIDKDGSFKYSTVLKVNWDDIQVVSMLPNPAHNFTLLKGINEYSVVKIIDLTGKVMLQQNITNAVKEINTSFLPAGMYLVQLVGSAKTVSLKLVKQ